MPRRVEALELQLGSKQTLLQQQVIPTLSLTENSVSESGKAALWRCCDRDRELD